MDVLGGRTTCIGSLFTGNTLLTHSTENVMGLGGDQHLDGLKVKDS